MEPKKTSCFCLLSRRGFNSFAGKTTKLSVNKTKWAGLLAITYASYSIAFDLSIGLHNGCFMSQVRRMWYFAWSVRQAGRRKIKHLLPVHCSGSSAHPLPQVLTDGDDVKRINQKTVHCSKLVSFMATRKNDNSIKHRK